MASLNLIFECFVVSPVQVSIFYAQIKLITVTWTLNYSLSLSVGVFLFFIIPLILQKAIFSDIRKPRRVRPTPQKDKLQRWTFHSTYLTIYSYYIIVYSIKLCVARRRFMALTLGGRWVRTWWNLCSDRFNKGSNKLHRGVSSFWLHGSIGAVIRY